MFTFWGLASTPVSHRRSAPAPAEASDLAAVQSKHAGRRKEESDRWDARCWACLWRRRSTAASDLSSDETPPPTRSTESPSGRATWLPEALGGKRRRWRWLHPKSVCVCEIPESNTEHRVEQSGQAMGAFKKATPIWLTIICGNSFSEVCGNLCPKVCMWKFVFSTLYAESCSMSFVCGYLLPKVRRLEIERLSVGIWASKYVCGHLCF